MLPPENVPVTVTSEPVTLKTLSVRGSGTINKFYGLCWPTLTFDAMTFSMSVSRGPGND